MTDQESYAHSQGGSSEREYTCPRCQEYWTVVLVRDMGKWQLLSDNDEFCPICCTLGKEL